MKQYDAVVIGAGHNGLTAACYLARAGLSVLALERRDVVGGACVTEELFPGFRINVASYTIGLLQPEIVDELELRRFGFESYVRDPQYMAPFPDRRTLTVFPDLPRTVREVAKFSERDAETWPRFEADGAKVATMLRPYLMSAPTNWTWGDVAARFKTPEEQHLFARFILGNTRDLVEAYFESDEIRGVQAFGGTVGTFVGPSTPGSAYSKTHHLIGQVNEQHGCFGYIRGGMGALTQTLARVLQHHGGEVRLNSPVSRVLVRDGSASGVVLDDGEEIHARLVLSNADPRRTLLDLVGEEHLEASVVTAVRRYRMEGCSYKINCALDALPHFTAIPAADQERALRGGVVICPSIDYLERAYREAVAGLPSRRPYVLIHFQTLTDPSLAPAGKHTMTLFGDYAPYHRSDGPWTPENKRALAEDVFDTVAEYAPNVREVLRDFMILTPPDIEQRFGISGGHIFHGDLTPEQLLSFRPIPGYSAYRMPLDNLYLCGSGAHPGGYVSGIPGRNAAGVVLADWRQRSSA